MRNDNKIYKVKYVDAYYLCKFCKKEVGHTKLLPHEAYGYMFEKNDSFFITFIKENTRGWYAEQNKIVEGIVIPKTMLISYNKKHKKEMLSEIKLNKKIKVTWQDIVYVKNAYVNKYSTMQSIGILHAIEKDHIVIKNPRTIRIEPKPAKKPTYYIIPLSAVTNIAQLDNIFKKLYDRIIK